MPETTTSPSHPAQIYFRIATLFALFAVVLGAFGAHALKETLSERGTLETWKTAVDYQFWHALALILWTIFYKTQPTPPKVIPLCFSLGILLFSGSLYILALGGPSWLGSITPLGGLTFMIGWSLWLTKGLKSNT